MKKRKYKWPDDVKVECDPDNDTNKRYILNISPKDKKVTKKILVIMCNPSTADKYWSDHTCKVLIRICEGNGYNSINICNLFSFRGTIKELNKAIEDSKANDELSGKKLEEQSDTLDEVLCAWGGPYTDLKNKKIFEDRIKEVLEILKSQKSKGKEILKLKFDKKDRELYPPHPQGKDLNTEFEPYCIERININ